MPQATQHIRPGTGLIPAPRTAPDGALAIPRADAPQPEGWGAALARCFTVARSLRSLRPVPAKQPQPYGEVDGQ
ncbi:hypothetical protein ACFV1L_33740 [Kitasatospora sp. NPDC059646]|uniref:hypothetical protein n=1 Tax=Kitasatospora sp. NPDC059646 TaxID=3346893 RepID=UPI0036B74A89